MRYRRGRALSQAASQLKEARSQPGKRLRLAAPDRPVEELLAQINGLLEDRETETRQLREREESLRRQIANVSHDLRTPLTSILGYLQLLEGDLKPEERSRYLQVVEERARVLQELITAFYDLSRIEGGEYHLEEGLPPVLADPGGVTRVLTNLLSNALKHGSTALTIRLFREGDFLVTSFSNDAPHLTQEDLPRVFERFYTGDQMRTGQNTGLGLAIVKALAQRMGHTAFAQLENGVFTVGVRWHMYR